MDDESKSSGTPKRRYGIELQSSPENGDDQMYNVEDESPKEAHRERFDLIKSISLVI